MVYILAWKLSKMPKFHFVRIVKENLYPIPVHNLHACGNKSVWILTCTSCLETVLPSPLTRLFRYNLASFHADMVCVSSSSSVNLDPWVPSCQTLRTSRRSEDMLLLERTMIIHSSKRGNIIWINFVYSIPMTVRLVYTSLIIKMKSSALRTPINLPFEKSHKGAKDIPCK